MEEFLNPEQVLKQLDLKEEMTAADFGSGSGGWAIPLAKILKEGKIKYSGISSISGLRITEKKRLEEFLK